jgi:hypothetical protein
VHIKLSNMKRVYAYEHTRTFTTIKLLIVLYSEILVLDYILMSHHAGNIEKHCRVMYSNKRHFGLRAVNINDNKTTFKGSLNSLTTDLIIGYICK